MDLPVLKNVKAENVEAACKKLGVEFDAKDLKSTVEAMSAKMGENAAADDLGVVVCETCKGDSTDDFEDCPYCGAGGVEEPDAPASPKVEAAPHVSDEAKAAAKKKASKKTAAKKTSKKASSKKASKKTAAKKTSKKASSKKVSKKTASKKTASKKASAKKPDPKSIATTTEGDVDVIMSASLKKSYDKIKTLQKAGAECAWELGNELAHVYENKLYLGMKGAGGKSVYTDWAKFARKEFHMVAAYSYKLMDLALNFDKKQAEALGVTKLTLIVQVPEQDRAHLLEQAKTTSKRKLAKEVAKLTAGKPRRDTGRAGRDGHGFKGTPGKGRGAQAARSEKLTVVKAKAKTEVDLYVEGTTELAEDWKAAVGEEKCANGQVIAYSFKRADDNSLKLVVEIKKEES